MAAAFDLPAVPIKHASGNSGVPTSDLLGEAFGSPEARPAGSTIGGMLQAASQLESAAKHLDFGAHPQAPPTPATPVAFPGSSSGVIDYNEFMIDTLLWKNKFRSAFWLIIGLIVAFTVRWLSVQGTPLISGISFLLLANLAFNFLRSLVSSRPSVSCQWSGSSLSRNAIYLFNEGVNAVSAVLDKHLSGSDPGATLQVAVGLWVLSLLARAVSAFHLLVTLFVAAFVLPLLYTKFKGQVDGTLHELWSTASGRFASLERLPKLAAVAVPTLALALLLTKGDLAIAVLIICVFLRTIMQPDEVTKLSRQVVDPVSKTAAAAGNAMYKFGADSAVRFDLTPTPSKKKAM